MTRSVRIAAAYIAFFAMLAHGLMPTGWMPGGSAGTPITICTMDGFVHVTLDAHGNPVKQKQQPADQRGHDVCPFGASVHFAAPLSVATVSVPTAWAYFRNTEEHARIHHMRAHYAPQSPRGPPSLA
ncbi:MAG TPA: DUF2946 family protein [Rhizomicrobium sp.]